MIEKTILVIEDDKSIQNFLKISLKVNNYKILESSDGITGISLFMSFNPDLILLDMGLPDIDGIEVIKQIRQSSNVPIIIVSARTQEREKVEALDAGADDYIIKPFGINELLARVRVALRNQKSTEITHEFVLDTIKIDYDRHKVYVCNQEIHFTPIEYKILTLLVENSGRVITHNFIQKSVWGYESDDEFQSLRVFMANIRKKIENDTSKPRFIMTEIGVGYRFADE